jgi:CzcA family heavy metal efflux pump
MLNAVIRFALHNRLLIVALALGVIVFGSLTAAELPIDVLPDLTRPRVVLLTECHGYSPEEVETLVTFPLEVALNGAPGVIAVRSNSDIGFSLIYTEFDWGTDPRWARQVVQERIATTLKHMPEGVTPQMAPQSSLLGQIMMIGMWSKDGTTGPLELRTQADWVVKQRLRAIPGIAQVITVGGGRKQFQILVDPHLLHRHEVTLHAVEMALRDSNLNVTGGYLNRGSEELLARGIGRLRDVEDIKLVAVKQTQTRPILLRDVARVVEAAQPKRGDASVNGIPAVVLTIQKQPGVDTRELTEKVNVALGELRQSLPKDVVLQPTYQQRQFIDFGISNVVEALRDGAILVVIVLFIFLLNVRTTFITLTAIPLSVLVTSLVFHWFGLSINVMTLGGIAVALGELVDDAIVDVENIFRRLKQNSVSESPKSNLRVVFDASWEVRGAIINSTIIVVLVFAPLFALTGMSGRLFTPLGVAYIVSILVSTVVSLTVTPVLSYYLLPNRKSTNRQSDGPVLAGLKWLVSPLIRLSMNGPALIGIVATVLLGITISVWIIFAMGMNFLPSFDEGAAQVNVYLKPGVSLKTTQQVTTIVDARFSKLLKTEANPNAPIEWFTCRMGRAEEDEHVMGVNVAEYVLSLNPKNSLTREGLIEELHRQLDDIPGIQVEVEQPIAHLISHMMSGVQAQIAIKLFGDDLNELRRQANEIKNAISEIDGIAKPVVEQQTLIPQLRIEVDRERLAYYGVTAGFVNEFVETALNGRVVSTLLDKQRTFDIVLRLDDPYRDDYANLDRVALELPDGRMIPLSEVATVRESMGPNIISREDTRRRIVIRANTLGLDLATAVQAIREKIESDVKLKDGYFISYEGQFEAQQRATQRILWLSLVAIIGVGVVLYSSHRSVSLVGQILFALPVAFIGGVAAIVLTGQTPSVASMVGFISLGGIAIRNGVLLVGHYVDRSQTEGYTKDMVLNGSLERLAPVLMTALTTGCGLIPLIMSGDLPGKEILYPVATVICGGLVTSTLCEFLIRPGLFWFLSRKACSASKDVERLDS